ncbi:MAG: restriction endonuclease subunit S, partial [Muribaculaceae bacterium]|nr:restriction endonuclease subunit S [Muribaculaceae bacterium]
MEAKDTQAKASNAADRDNNGNRVDNIDRVNRVSKVLNVSNDNHTRHPKHGWEVKKLKDICEKESSNIAQNKIVNLDGDYPIFGASGFVQNINFYHRNTPYIGIVKDGSGVGRVNIYPAYSSLLG